MTIFTALEKLDTLTEGELEHCIQRLACDIAHYETCISRYPPDRMKRCGMPHLKRLQAWKQRFVDKLVELGG